MVLIWLSTNSLTTKFFPQHLYIHAINIGHLLRCSSATVSAPQRADLVEQAHMESYILWKYSHKPSEALASLSTRLQKPVHAVEEKSRDSDPGHSL